MDVSGPAREGEKPAPVWIYRHPLRLEFEGAYFDVLAYLAELERGPWEFGWRQLNYQVREYPVAEVTLEIETLSREKSSIGV
jgi:MSHA biogenesis protein MshJ